MFLLKYLITEDGYRFPGTFASKKPLEKKSPNRYWMADSGEMALGNLEKTTGRIYRHDGYQTFSVKLDGNKTTEIINDNTTFPLGFTLRQVLIRKPYKKSSRYPTQVLYVIQAIKNIRGSSILVIERAIFKDKKEKEACRT